ncbi:O-antigen ligase family protein [Butyrivibrio sp. NC2007]|uniref:O-antigen ligase family protein n=1 Tax=Butyrivibrio sp. NC2007 TaxID=1280683 RepID=UPI0003B76846|nr:hypothetical protein [Butyrivibrio sp. NC2007]
MKYITFNKKNILVILLLLLPERFAYLVNQNAFASIFHIAYSDFVIAIYFLLFLYVLFHYKISEYQNYYFASNVLLIVPLVLMASVVPYFLFGQAVLGAIIAQKCFLMLLCFYYTVRTLILEKVVTPDYLWNCLYKLSFVVTGAVIIQHALVKHIRILSVSYATRFGIRIYDNVTFANILLIGSLFLFFTASNRREKITAALGLVMSYYHIMIVSQTRIIMVATGVMTIVMALFYRNSALKKITYIFIILGIALIISQTELAQYLLSALGDSSTDPSAQIREIGRVFYIYEIGKTPLVGRGFPRNEVAYQAAGLYNNIFLNDNGLYGFAYIYGIIGLIWYIWLSVKMIICSFKVAKKGDYRFLLLVVYLQVVSPNIITWYWRPMYSLFLAIMLALMEQYANADSEHKVRIYFGN